MKAFDRLSIRGVVFSVLGLAGIAYEVFTRPAELLVVLLYGFVVLLGMWLIFFKSEERE